MNDSTPYTKIQCIEFALRLNNPAQGFPGPDLAKVMADAKTMYEFVMEAEGE